MTFFERVKQENIETEWIKQAALKYYCDYLKERWNNKEENDPEDLSEFLYQRFGLWLMSNEFYFKDDEAYYKGMEGEWYPSGLDDILALAGKMKTRLAAAIKHCEEIDGRKYR